MRAWALQLEAQRRLSEERAAAPIPDLIHPYLALSRETGVNARELAEAVAQRCGWKLFDRELLDYLAEHDNLSRLSLEFVDEKAVSWFHEMFGTWLDEKLVSQAEYVSRLGRIVLLAAQHESTVFIGRGVQFILPRENGVSVRLIDSLAARVRRVEERQQCGEREARKFIEQTDSARAQFVQRYYHHNLADPHLYDLTINLEYVPRAAAVDLLVAECRRRVDDKHTKPK